MPNKPVTNELCKERSSNILEKISDVDKKLDKWMTNHAAHMQDDMKEIRGEIIEINKKILFIMNKFENDELIKAEKEKEKKDKIDWAKWITPILTGIAFSILNILLKHWGYM
jgi:ribosome-binding ATPase YchF (GTP1/OBG family)